MWLRIITIILILAIFREFFEKTGNFWSSYNHQVILTPNLVLENSSLYRVNRTKKCHLVRYRFRAYFWCTLSWIDINVSIHKRILNKSPRLNFRRYVLKKICTKISDWATMAREKEDTGTYSFLMNKRKCVTSDAYLKFRFYSCTLPIKNCVPRYLRMNDNVSNVSLWINMCPLIGLLDIARRGNTLQSSGKKKNGGNIWAHFQSGIRSIWIHTAYNVEDTYRSIVVLLATGRTL